MREKYPSDIPYTLSKSDLEGRLIKIKTNEEPNLVRINEVKEDGDRKGNRTILVKHVLQNKTELVLAKHLRSVKKREKFTVIKREFETKNGWKSIDEISEDEKQYSNTGKVFDRFIERTAIVKNHMESDISHTVIQR